MSLDILEYPSKVELGFSRKSNFIFLLQGGIFYKAKKNKSCVQVPRPTLSFAPTLTLLGEYSECVGPKVHSWENEYNFLFRKFKEKSKIKINTDLPTQFFFSLYVT